MEEYRPEEFRSGWKQVVGSWIVFGLIALIFLGFSIAIRSIEYGAYLVDSTVVETDVQVVSK